MTIIGMDMLGYEHGKART